MKKVVGIAISGFVAGAGIVVFFAATPKIAQYGFWGFAAGVVGMLASAQFGK